MKCLIYVRYSPRPDETCESLEFQENYARRYFDFLGIEVAKVIRDPETSARLVPLAKRKGGAELLSLTTGSHPKYSTIGAYRLDRLFRDVVDGATTLRAWRRAGVACHFAAEGGQSLNTATATGRFIVNVLLSKSEYEPDLTAERTSEAMIRHQSNGRAQSKEPPYGQQPGPIIIVNEKPRQTWEGNMAELAVIERIRSLRANGRPMSYRQIANLLNAEAVPARGRAWHHGLVSRICRRV